MAKNNIFRMALVSMKTIPGDLDANLARHLYWIERAMEKKPDFIGFPEFGLTGWIEESSQMLSPNAAALREVDRWARQFRVTLGVCYVEKRGGLFYNACRITGPRGLAGVMRKINLVRKEAKVYTAGREFPVFDTGRCRIGVATCADASCFEMVHLLSLRGAELIFAPHANSLGAYGNCRDGWARWRLERWPLFAGDACAVIAGVSCAGLYERPRRGEEVQKYCGGGMVMDWTGKPLARLCGANKREGWLAADLDLAALRATRKTLRESSCFRPDIVYNRKQEWMEAYEPGHS